MTVRFAGPHPLYETFTYMPNPDFGDSEGYGATVSRKRTIDNTLYTYVKSKDGRKRLQMRFQCTRSKALEFRAFLQAYYRTEIELTDHLGNRWIGWITTNPNEFEASRAIQPVIVGIRNINYREFDIGRSLVTIQIEFEGLKQ